MNSKISRTVIRSIVTWCLLVVLSYVLTLMYSKPQVITPNFKAVFQVIALGLVVNPLIFSFARIFRTSIGAVTFGLIGLCAIFLLLLSVDNYLWLKGLIFFATFFLMGVSARRVYCCLFDVDLPFFMSMLLAFVALHFALFASAFLFQFNVCVVSAMFVFAGLYGVHDLVKNRKKTLSGVADFFASVTWPESFLYQGMFFSICLAFVAAYAPETYSDAMRVHVPHMAEMVRVGGLTPNTYMYAALQPSPFQLLVASGYLFLGQLGAKWITLLIGICGIALIIREVYDLSGRRFISLTTGFLLITIPFIWLWLTTNYYDWPMTVFCLATFNCLRRFFEDDIKYLPLVGVFSGFAISIKFNAALFVIPLFIFSVILFHNRFSEAFMKQRRYFIFSIIGFLVVLTPWLVLIWHWTGNPFFPFLNGIFKSPYISSEFLRVVLGKHHLLFKFPLGAWDLIAWPWSLTFETRYFGETVNGAIGPFFLAAFVPATALVATGIIQLPTDGRLSRLVILMALTAVTYLAAVVFLMEGTPYIRFWLPVIALFFVAGGVSLTALSRYMPTMSLASQVGFSAILVVVAISILFGWGVRLNWAASNGIAWNLYRGKISRDQYLQPLTGNVYTYVNANLKQGESVLAVGYNFLSEINGFSLQLNPVFDLNLGPNSLTKYDKLVGKLNVRYWIVSDDFRGKGAKNPFYNSIGVEQKYWLDRSLVYSSDGFSVFTTEPELQWIPQSRQ